MARKDPCGVLKHTIARGHVRPVAKEDTKRGQVNTWTTIDFLQINVNYGIIADFLPT